MRQRIPGSGVGEEFRETLDVDIKCIEKQPAIRRIGAAIAWPVVEQRMQGVEADAVGPEMMGKLYQSRRSVKSPIPQLRAERTP